jgi:predicted PhzF superfamily epimerase YddE/YHI9
LVGHATLATAHVLFSHLKIGESGVKKITFSTLSGDLFVEQYENGLLEMDFPQGMLLETLLLLDLSSYS